MASRNCAINANEAFLVECSALRYYTPHNSSQGCGQAILPAAAFSGGAAWYYKILISSRAATILVGRTPWEL